MDTIANMLVSIINAQHVRKQRVAVQYSKSKESLAKLLKEKGLLAAVRVQEGDKPRLVLTLAYDENGSPRINGAKRISKPGRRMYVKHTKVPYSWGGAGMMVLSTPEGLMDDAKARKSGLGGELVCEIW